MVRGKVRVGTSNRCEDGNMSASREWVEGAAAANKKWSDVQENEANRKYPSEGGKCLEHKSNFFVR